jgi:hypothetical protein
MSLTMASTTITHAGIWCTSQPRHPQLCACALHGVHDQVVGAATWIAPAHEPVLVVIVLGMYLFGGAQMKPLVLSGFFAVIVADLPGVHAVRCDPSVWFTIHVHNLGCCSPPALTWVHSSPHYSEAPLLHHAA